MTAPAPLVLLFRVNGVEQTVLAPPQRTLLNVLRDDLGLTGSKHGCDVGDCGACTVLLEDSPRLSCITLAAEAHEREVTTIEGLGAGDHPIQRAFDEQVAAQCGYCTPGFILSLKSLLDTNPAASEEEIRSCLGSNICRCTGYTKILAAAQQAQRHLAGEDS